MINISVSNVNSRSPYHITSPEDGLYTFTTDQGKSYEIGFIQDYMISDDGIYQFFINAKDKFKTLPDKKIEQTVKVVLEEFFKQRKAVLNYICDTGDNRQAARNRIFEKWFRQFAGNERFTLHTMSMEVDGSAYFAAVILRNDNPRKSHIMNAINNFRNDLEDKLG